MKEYLTCFALAVLVLLCGTVSAADQCDSESDSEHCQQSYHDSQIAQVARLQSGGLDGEPTLPDLLSFPNYKQPGEKFNVAKRIGTHYKEFGIHLLVDNDGTEMGILEKDKSSDSVGIVTEVFRMWLKGHSGLTPRAWKVIVHCLREVKLTALADDIENFFTSVPDPTLMDNIVYTPGSSFMPKMSALWKDREQFYRVFHLLQHVNSSIEAIRVSGIGDSEIKVYEVAHDLKRIINRLQDGKLRIGVVGLTKAGKSTFLNALLGKSFLPSSIQPQTANEVVIVHNMSVPDGVLYCVVEGVASTVATGHREIFLELLELNDDKREKGENSKCDKLVLHAPLQFLAKSNIQDVRLELSDTPGFGEAGVKEIAHGVDIAVKELCAFVLIFSSQNLKSTSELKLLKKLIFFHPELFSKLNRVLILVNAHSNVYSEGKLSLNSATLRPEAVPSYVSDYLNMRESLNIHIPPEKIILFNALWALRARTWNTSGVLKADPNAKTLYKEAMLMLRYINQDSSADELEDDWTSEESISRTVSLLEPFSRIDNVEGVLRKMVLENGGLVLLESAVDDTTSVIGERLLPVIKDLIAGEHVEAKEEIVKSLEELAGLFKDILSSSQVVFDKLHSSLLSSTRVHVSTLHDSVVESLNNVVSSKLMDGLRESTQLEDRKKVVEEMRKARDTIPNAALAKIKHDWLTVSDTIRTATAEQIRRIFSDIRTDFLSSLSQVNTGPEDSDLDQLVEDLSTTVSNVLVTASESSTSLVPDFIALSIDELAFVGEGSEAVQDGSIDTYIYQGKKQKFRTNQRKKCGGGFLGWGKSCVSFTEAIPYDQAVFSPNLNAFKSAFDGIVQTWMGLYDDQVQSYLKEISLSTSSAGKDKLTAVLKEPLQRVNEMLEASQTALDKSKGNISFLENKKEELKNLKKSLRKSIK